MKGTRLSLTATIVVTVCVFVAASVFQGALALISTSRSEQQAMHLERQGVEPVVALGGLSQNLDQERALLESDRAGLTADQARAVIDEVHGLDSSISRTAQENLPMSLQATWKGAWTDFVQARAPLIAQLEGIGGRTLRPALRARMDDRLDVVLDLVQSSAGVELYRGERLYAQTLAGDRNAMRMVIVSFLLSLAIGLAIAYLLARRLTRGLGNLCITADLVTDGALTARADERGRDEIAQLARAINRMKDALLSAELRAGTDALTGLPNHRAIITALDQELERGHRYGRPCTLLFFDLDHFKALNDGYGHAVGDAVLTEFAQVVRSSLRGVDILGRWGGEEFVALLPEVSRDRAHEPAEHVRKAVAAHAFTSAGGAHLTCSVGIAAYPEDALDRTALVSAADYAMYAAKHLGRNQTRTAIDPAVEALQQGAAREGSREETFLVGTIEALAALVDARDHYTGEHTTAVVDLCRRLALALGLDAVQAKMVERAARLHDVGKVAIPDVLLQKPGRFTEEETAVMRSHATVGADIIARVPALQLIVPLIRAHHEWWDGTGYPDNLAGEAIPLGARIIAVADAYSAMTADRPYREALDGDWALHELRRAAGSQFDPRVVEGIERVLMSTALLQFHHQAS